MPKKMKKATLKDVIALALRKKSFFGALVKNRSTALGKANLVLSAADRRKLEQIFTKKMPVRVAVNLAGPGGHPPPPPPWSNLLVQYTGKVEMKDVFHLIVGDGKFPTRGNPRRYR